MEYNKFLTFKEYKKEYYDIFSRIVKGNDLSYDKYIKNTIEYIGSFKLYKLLLSRLKKIFNLLGIDNSLDITLLCTYFLIPNAILSIGNKFDKKIENYANFEFVNTLGSKVLSGNAVCRHVSKFILDINRMCGNESYFIPVNDINDNSGHVLVGLNINNEKFIIDPLNMHFGVMNKDIITCFDPLENKVPINYKLNRNKLILEKLNYIDVSKFLKLKNGNNIDIFKKHYDYMKLKYLYFKDLFENFKYDNLELYKEIVSYLEILCGYEYNNKTKKLIK